MYIFGYGSIINRHTRMNGSQADLPVRLHGYSRGWNTRIYYKGVTSLGITNKPGSVCNGVLVFVTPSLLDEIDKREKPAGHSRKKILLSEFEALSDTPLSLEGEIFTHVSDEQLLPTKEYPLIQTYIDTVLFGCLEHGEDFIREFIRTTEHWDSPLIDDRTDTRYPRWKSEYVDSTANAILADELVR